MLKQAALDHYLDIAKNGITLHKGSDGSTYKDRIEKYAMWGGAIYETMEYMWELPDVSDGQEESKRDMDSNYLLNP
jgi:hypothetical protein